MLRKNENEKNNRRLRFLQIGVNWYIFET